MKRLVIWAVTALLAALMTPAQASDQELEPCKLPSLNKLYHQDVGWPRDPLSMPATGEQKMLIVLVDFPDAAADPNLLGKLPDVMQLRTISAFYSSIGQRKFILSFDLYPKIVTLSKPSIEYGGTLNEDAIINDEYESHKITREALDSITYGVDLYAYAGAIVVVGAGQSLSGAVALATSGNPDQGHPSGAIRNYITVGHDALYLKSIKPWRMFVHEINHLLGITDFYVYGPDGWWQGRSPGPFGQQGFLQGDTKADSLAYNRWLRGWIPDEKVKCFGSLNSSVNLDLLAEGSRASGFEMVLIRLNANKVLVIESPKENGFASHIAPRSLLVYTIDNSVKIGEGPLQIIPKPSPTVMAPLSPELPDWDRFKNAELQSGESVKFQSFAIVNDTRATTGEVVQLRILVGGDIKESTIKCVKKRVIKRVTGVSPRCPEGYVQA